MAVHGAWGLIHAYKEIYIFSSTILPAVNYSEGLLLASAQQIMLREGQGLPSTEILIMIYFRTGRCGERAAGPKHAKNNFFHSGAA